MAYKTMLRQLISKWGIMSIDMQQAMDADMGVIRNAGTVDYVDNQHASEAEIVEAENEVVQPEPAGNSDAVQQALFG